MSEKEKVFNKLREKMLNANLPLKKTAKNLVFGTGSLDPKVFFIGEAPGAKEDVQGLPFVGAAGKQLDLLLESISLSRESVYITSILKYRPPGNRPPTLAEIRAHTPFLVEQIRILAPPVIVTLGNFATRFILAGLNIENMSKVPGITQIHGQPHKIHFEGMDVKVVPVFHPAAILYRRPLKEILQNDFQIIAQII